jgi:hypothetical protein
VLAALTHTAARAAHGAVRAARGARSGATVVAMHACMLVRGCEGGLAALPAAALWVAPPVR